MSRQDLAEAIERVIQAAEEMDPNESVPVYDLHDLAGLPTPYCLVRASWLDVLWRGTGEPPTSPAMMPHDHIDPSIDGYD